MQIEFGSNAASTRPIAEAAIIGRAIGLATRGLKPIPEIQFFDYIWPAMMQIRDELATLRWRSDDTFSAPMVIRVADRRISERRRDLPQPVRRSDLHPHSRLARGDAVERAWTLADCCEPLSARTIRCCSWNTSAYTASRTIASQHPGPEYTIPFGKAKVVKSGHSLTVVTYGALVQKTLQAALQIEQRYPEKSVEVIDLRSLSPYDWPAIRASVEKTSRVILAYEDSLSWGYGAELAARIADELFEYLDAPVGRVAALDTWVGYHPQLESEILPQVENLVTEAERLINF